MSALAFASFVARLLLAAIFAVAAWAKVRDREATRMAAMGLGVPRPLSRPVAAVLPAVELLVAVALIVTALAPIGALAAAMLLGAFTVLLAGNLVAGRRPACACFGAASASPIGGATLGRNAVLLVAAALVAARGVDGGADALGAFSALSVAQIWAMAALGVSAVAFACGVRLAVDLVAQNGRLLERVERLEHQMSSSISPPQLPPVESRRRPGLPTGAAAPRFALADLRSATVSIDDLLSGGLPLVLVFVEPACAACVALGDELALRESPFSDRRVALVGHGRREDVAGAFGSVLYADVLVDEGGTIAGRYGVVGTPSAVLVLPDGRVGRALAEGRAAVSGLLDVVLPDRNLPDTERITR